MLSSRVVVRVGDAVVPGGRQSGATLSAWVVVRVGDTVVPGGRQSGATLSAWLVVRVGDTVGNDAQCMEGVGGLGRIN
jgi:hypothetical protein